MKDDKANYLLVFGGGLVLGLFISLCIILIVNTNFQYKDSKEYLKSDYTCYFISYDSFKKVDCGSYTLNESCEYSYDVNPYGRYEIITERWCE